MFEIEITSEVSPLGTTGTIVIEDQTYEWVASMHNGEWVPVLIRATVLELQKPETAKTAKARIKGTLAARETLEKVRKKIQAG